MIDKMKMAQWFKKIRLLIFILVFADFAYSQGWTQLADLPGLERDDGVARAIGNKAYFGTGLRSGFTLGNDFYVLDLSTNTWSSIASMPSGSERQYAVAFTYSNFLFVHGGSGYAGAMFSNTFRYDVATNTWTTVSEKPGMPVMAAGAFAINNKAYVFSGRFPNDKVSDEVWEYDMLNDTWTQKNNFPFGGRWRASAASLNNYGYVCFGKDSSGSYRKEMYRYNPSSDTWAKVGNFPLMKGRYYVGMQPVNDKLVMFGGVDSTEVFYKDCWYFDESNGFLPGPDLPSFGRRGGLSCSSGDKFYYSCGATLSLRLKETWMLDLPVGLNEIESVNRFVLYPNPAQGKLLCKAQSGVAEPYILEFADLSGRVVKMSYINRMQELVDIQDLEAGIYFVKIQAATGAAETKKLIVR
jgi:N-acetylneuraminic acid mutarotase